MSGAAIRFDIMNPQTPDAGAVIYISDDAATWGRLTITLTNTSTDNSDLTLDPLGVLQIYPEMLRPDDIKAITLPDGSAWAALPVATNRHVALHPKQTITIASQDSVTIELDNVLGHAPRQGKFRFYYASLGVNNVVVQGFVQRPPSATPNPWQVAAVLDPRVEYQDQGGTIFVTAPGGTDIPNYLLVHLYRQAGGTLPSAGTPAVSVSFLTGDGDLALCSEDRLKKISASIADQRPDGRWQIPVAESQGQDTVWTVAPHAGASDLFPEDGLLILRFDNIVSDLPAGGTATLFVQCTGLTGYDDGYIQLQLNKAPPVPYVRDFHAVSGGQRVQYGGSVIYGQVTLYWDVFAADDCLVGPTGRPTQTVSCTGHADFPADIKGPSYTLVPRVGGAGIPQPPLILQLALPAASGQHQLTDNWSGWDPMYTLALDWSTTGAATCTVTSPAYGHISDQLSGHWQQGNIQGTGSDQDASLFPPFTIEVTNPAGTTATQVIVW